MVRSRSGHLPAGVVPLVLWAAALALLLGGGASARAQEGVPALDAAPPARPAAQAPSPVASEASGPGIPLTLPALARAWAAPARSLADRVERAHRVAEAAGIESVDPLGRALLIDDRLGGRLERAEAAVRLAPELPAAHLALAEASWRDGRGPLATLSEGLAALRVLPRHLESRLWLEATLAHGLMVTLLGAALLWIAARGLCAIPTVAHDLGDALDRGLPGYVGMAAVSAVVLAPAALGEGAFGAAVALFGLAWLRGGARERRTLVAAAALAVVALGPLADAAGRRLAALDADPVVLACAAAESGFVDPVDAARIERAAPGDRLALHALARALARAGELDRARGLLAQLLARDAHDPVALNDAASVELASGHFDAAIDLYRRAIAERPSAQLWFNLAQAHVRALDMEGHESALAAAQALDPAAASELTRRLADGEPGDGVPLPLGTGRMRARLLAAADPAAGRALRARVAPGLLGDVPWLAGLAFAAAAVLASLIGRSYEASSLCTDCGLRLCRRCETGEPAAALCTACARARVEARHGGPWESSRREGGLAALGRRALRMVLRLVPGLAEREPARPGAAFAAVVAAAGALALAAGREGALPDPASVGAAGPLALAAAAALLALAFLALSSWARAGRHR